MAPSKCAFNFQINNAKVRRASVPYVDGVVLGVFRCIFGVGILLWDSVYQSALYVEGLFSKHLLIPDAISTNRIKLKLSIEFVEGV